MNSPCDKLHRRAAQELADAMRERLQACSPTPRAVAARQARMDDIERAMSERERLAREDAEEGRRLERQQRMQELERREKKQANRARRRACVIYDSSYLMDGRMFLHHRLLNASTIHNIVPLQVMQEIGSMIEAGDARRSLAARGRGRILELKKEVDRRPHTLGYGETDLSALQPVPREGPLDADSDTDRRLIALAFDVLRSNEDSTVVIASSDGGIGYTVDRLRRRTGARLFRVSDARITGEIRPVEECLQAIGASDS